MNAFYEHHKNSIRFQYRCFDRILLNGLIQPFQQEQRVGRFFRNLPRSVSRKPRCVAGDLNSVSELGSQPVKEVGRADSRCARRPTG